MNVIWIASYPRSGNTWMRMLLHDVLFGPAESSEAMNRMIPDIHRMPRLPIHRKGRILAKTHFCLRPEHPYLMQTGGCIYLIRNPRDVAISAVRYARLFNAAQGDSAAFIRAYIERGGIEEWLNNGFGTWEQHAGSWINPPNLPRVVVRYENLRNDTAAELGRVCEFLGVDASPEKIAGAVGRNEIDRLRKMEDREKQNNRCWFPGSVEQLKMGTRFFNEGRTGQRLDDIEPGLDALFDERFGEAMRRHGYASDVCEASPCEPEHGQRRRGVRSTMRA